jgi:AraC-like DNA-binding protein
VQVSLHPRLIYAGMLKRSIWWKEAQHSHHFLEIIFISSGSGVVELGDQRHPLGIGDIVIYNAGSPHNEISSAADPLEIYFFAVQNISLDGLAENHLIADDESNIIHSGDEAPQFRDYFSQLVIESQNDRYFSKEMTESLTRMILILILRLVSLGNEKYLKTNHLYLNAKAFIDANYAIIAGVEDVCTNVYISNYYLTHLFRLYGDKTPLQYIIQKKIDFAKTLLAGSDITVCDIASRCGYDNVNHFCRVFKSHEKCTPQEYREREAGNGH